MGNSPSTRPSPDAQPTPQETPQSDEQALPIQEFFARSELLIQASGCWDDYLATVKCIMKMEKSDEGKSVEDMRAEVSKKCPNEVRNHPGPQKQLEIVVWVEKIHFLVNLSSF